MSSLYPENWTSYLNIVLILLRFLGVFLLSPFFSSTNVPMNIKLLLALVISLAFYPYLQKNLGPFPMETSLIFMAVIRETSIGLLLGLGCYLTFEAIALGAHFIGYQMGLGAANQMDPQNHNQVTVMVPLQSLIALMIFLALNMHHSLIALFIRSYEVTASFSNMTSEGPLFQWLIRVTSELFVLSIQMAAPFTLVLTISQIALGVLSRLIPQMNVFLLSFPITVLLGLATFYLVAPEYLDKIENSFEGSVQNVINLLRTF